MLVQVWPLVHRNNVFPIRRVLVQNFDMGHSPHSALIIGKSKFMSESTCLDLECQAISPDIQSDTLQVKSQILVKHPINNKIIWLPSADADSLWVNTPAIGKPKKGISEVTGIGSASVTHNMAVNRVIEAVEAIRWGCPIAIRTKYSTIELIADSRISLLLVCIKLV